MDRVAVFVDAGYLFAQGSVSIAGEKLQRDATIFDATEAIKSLKALAFSKAPACNLLRIYWYDGAPFGASLTTDQVTLAHLDDVKVRLGFVNSHGQQKGVDSLIVTDLIELARLNSITDAVLLSGDEDVRVGVQIAQSYGVRVHLIGIHPSRGSQSRQLQQEADTNSEWEKPDIERFLSLGNQNVRTPQSTTSPASSSSATRSGEVVVDIKTAVRNFAQGLNQSELDAAQIYWENDRGVPIDLDRRLLPAMGHAIGRRLERDEIKLVRAEFQKAVKEILDVKT